MCLSLPEFTSEVCIANIIFKYWNGIVPVYIHKMFKPSRCRYSSRSLVAIHNLVSKMLERRLLSCMLLRKIYYIICKANSNNCNILMVDIIISFSHSNIVFFLVITGVLLCHLSYFNLVFLIIFTYTSSGEGGPNGNKKL